jgi:hypothetical protein
LAVHNKEIITGAGFSWNILLVRVLYHRSIVSPFI